MIKKIVSNSSTAKNDNSGPETKTAKTLNGKKEVNKGGRKSHRVVGVEYVRINPAIPVTLKKEMDEYIKSNLQNEYSTIDRFVEAAIRKLLIKN